MAGQSRTAQQSIEAIASRAHGVVTRSQLLAAGLSSHEIQGRLSAGILLVEHRGIYRVGHRAPSVHASYLAAVLACGSGAVLGGLAAAYNFGLVKGSPPRSVVISPDEHRVPGVVCRRSRRLDRRDTTVWRGIPSITVARALVEIAGWLDDEHLARACHEAGVRYATTPRQVDRALSRLPNARRTANLRAVMAGDTKVTLSRLESRFLELLRAEGLPLPQTNRRAGGRRVDCRWPARWLTVELDSYGYHNSRHAWEADRRRERQAYARGDSFRRFTWGDVFEHPAAMLGELRLLLR